ncbi:hypothetical protein Hpkin81_06150 [Helicobacter pylori]
MQEISAYELIKEKLHAIPNQRHKGSLFEKISKQFLQEHDSANEYESIDLWYDWKLRGKERDKGIGYSHYDLKRRIHRRAMQIPSKQHLI